MRKKILVLLLFIIGIKNVYASSGALRKSSIKMCPDGLYYGQHSENKQLHWHQAEPRPDVSSGWIAVGSPIYSDPCPGGNYSETNYNETNNNQNTVENKPIKEETKPVEVEEHEVKEEKEEPKEEKPVEDINETEEVPIDIPNEPKKSDNNKIASVIIDGETVLPFGKNIKYTTRKSKVEIKVNMEDEKASYQVEDYEYLYVDDVNQIKIVTMSESGVETTYYLSIKRDFPKILSLEVNGKETSIIYKNRITINTREDLKKININYKLSEDDAYIIIKQNGKEIDGSIELLNDKNITLTVIDKNGITDEYELYILKTTLFEEVTGYITGVAMLGGGYYYFKKRKK